MSDKQSKGICLKCMNSVSECYSLSLMPMCSVGENKGADQLRGNRKADQRLCFRYNVKCANTKEPLDIISLSCTNRTAYLKWLTILLFASLN